MRSLLVAAALVAVSLLPRVAVAGCALGEQVSFAPPSGTPLPPQAAIYVFVRKHPAFQKGEPDEIGVKLDGRPAEVKKERIFQSERYDTWRIHVPPRRAATLVVTARIGEKEAVASYRIAAGAEGTALSNRETRIVKAEYRYETGCPPVQGFELTVEPWAPAYRVEWDGPTAESGQQGAKAPRSVVVPDGASERRKGDPGQLGVGVRGCDAFGISAPDPFALRITPLGADGEEGDTFMLGCRKTKENGAEGMTCTSHASISFSGEVKVVP